MNAPSTLTRQLSAHDTARLVREVGLSNCIRGVAVRIEHCFQRWSDFDVCARVASHSRLGVIELMPVADCEVYAFKYVNGHPANTADGLPTVMAFGVLADVATGLPTFMAELTLVTAIRTAAMSAWVAQRLARPHSRVMALIGNGAQAEFQAIAFRDLLGIRSLRVFDVDPKATDKLVRNLTGSGITIERCASVAQAVRGADIVTTVTADKRQATIIAPGMVQPGMHFNAVGGDCPGKTELHPDILNHARVVVEYEAQTRLEGELQQMPPDFAVTELWQVLAGHAPGRQNDQEVTVFDSVGFALEDFSAMRYLEQYVLPPVTCKLDLIPKMADPKDLYGMATISAARQIDTVATLQADIEQGLPIPA